MPIAGLDPASPRVYQDNPAIRPRTETETNRRVPCGARKHGPPWHSARGDAPASRPLARPIEISPRFDADFDRAATPEWVRPCTISYLLTDDAWGGEAKGARTRKGAAFALLPGMSDDSKLPSARLILESDAAASRNPITVSTAAEASTDDDDFRRVMSALRAVLQIRGA